MKKWWLVGLGIALAVVLLLAPHASKNPDGLERVAERFDFQKAEHPIYHGPLPDYTVSIVTHETTSNVAAGVIGTVSVFALAWGVGAWLRRSARKNKSMSQ
jgi:cobalt/nickel transport protein